MGSSVSYDVSRRVDIERESTYHGYPKSDPQAPYYIAAKGRLMHRVRGQTRQITGGIDRGRVVARAWCGALHWDPQWHENPDFVCGTCEKAATRAGEEPSLALPEGACEAWHGGRYAKR